MKKIMLLSVLAIIAILFSAPALPGYAPQPLLNERSLWSISIFGYNPEFWLVVLLAVCLIGILLPEKTKKPNDS
jgi:hypothetical protein